MEHTFGILKSRWRILNYINVNNIERAIDIITACCVLHNFCYIKHDVWDEYMEVIHEADQYGYLARPPINAINKRNRIAEGLRFE